MSSNPELEHKNKKMRPGSLPDNVDYWLTDPSEHDCFFIVGPESERIGAIRAFLRGYSEPFRVMLGKGPLAEKGDIRLEDVKPHIFLILLKCAYGMGDKTVESLSLKDSLDFLSLVDRYLVTEFKEKVGKHIARFLEAETLTSYFEIISNPSSFQEEILDSAISAFTVQNATKILSSELLLNARPDALLYIVKNPLLQTREVIIWKTVLDWAKVQAQSNDVKAYREVVENFLDHIRFENMTFEELCSEVLSTGIMTSEEITEICKVGCKQPVVKFAYNPVPNKTNAYEITFSHTVSIVSSFFGREHSQHFPLNYYSWWISVKKLVSEEGAPNLSLFVGCKSDIARPWQCKLKGRITLVNQARKPCLYKEFESEMVLNENNSSCGWDSFCLWTELVNPAEGFVKDDIVIVRANLTIDYDP